MVKPQSNDGYPRGRPAGNLVSAARHAAADPRRKLTWRSSRARARSGRVDAGRPWAGQLGQQVVVRLEAVGSDLSARRGAAPVKALAGALARRSAESARMPARDFDWFGVAHRNATVCKRQPMIIAARHKQGRPADDREPATAAVLLASGTYSG
jgi:hypothetical protein